MLSPAGIYFPLGEEKKLLTVFVSENGFHKEKALAVVLSFCQFNVSSLIRGLNLLQQKPTRDKCCSGTASCGAAQHFVTSSMAIPCAGCVLSFPPFLILLWMVMARGVKSLLFLTGIGRGFEIPMELLQKGNANIHFSP